MKRIYYFTDNYPFSDDYTWKSAEINQAAMEFDEVVIVPFTYIKDNTFTFPKNVRVVNPTLRKSFFAKRKYLKHVFASTQPQPWYFEIFKALLHGKKGVVDWYLSTVYSNIIVQKDIFKELKDRREEQGQIVLFFQWTMHNALIVPLLYKWGYRHIVCRMHGYDLYEFRHNNYIPYKKEILKRSKICTFISEHGRNYAAELYPFIKKKYYLHYLGANAMAQNEVSNRQKFHIISVSRIIPLKRVELIIEALKQVKIPIKWTHIGDGPGDALHNLKKIVAKVSAKNPTCEVEFLGWLTPDAIRSYFSKSGINALILVSETEGLPLVIMEAFSASIPVIATDVGGISELVNSKNGILLNSNPEVEEVVDAIEVLANETFELHQLRRQEALQSYLKSFDLAKNSKNFIDFLAQQCS
ncbi:glycosyltransferase [Gelidibacter gilvus]|uniref:Glycosyltransferase n=1 Tax=Gelidibacter gilvus TaxID=59602 RepID=A0A4Q0XEQ4_9FLAO|nr:glycosyltransferase [Gelidibacter gilvus]RXJ46038.1 glycosyltransferase [Gelidibacter gilvus]